MLKLAAALADCKPDPTVAEACYSDSNEHRIMPTTIAISDPGNTLESCATACDAAGFPVFGVEFGVACFCAPDGWPAGVNATRLPATECVFVCGRLVACLDTAWLVGCLDVGLLIDGGAGEMYVCSCCVVVCTYAGALRAALLQVPCHALRRERVGMVWRARHPAGAAHTVQWQPICRPHPGRAHAQPDLHGHATAGVPSGTAHGCSSV